MSRRRGIEIRGLKARLYDQLVLAGTLGLYQKVLEDAIARMKIGPGERILDLGAGTGKNALLMRRYLGDGGGITAVETSPEMMRRFAVKCGAYPNIRLEAGRIEEPLSYRGEFDRAVLSFVLHGFVREERESILANASAALKTGGVLNIFDWNETDLDGKGIVFRLFMRCIECPEARDFVRVNLEDALRRHGLSAADRRLYYRGRIRLLTAVNTGGPSVRGGPNQAGGGTRQADGAARIYRGSR